MNTRFRYVVAVMGIFASVPQYADAAEYRVTYKGEITDGSDIDNVFGFFGQSLSGRDLRADITYSTSVAQTRISSLSSDEVAGGEAFGTAPVISSAVFTIGSASFTLSAPYYGDVYTSPEFIDTYGYDLLGNSFQTFITPNKLGPVSLQLPFYSTGVGDGGGASTQYSFLIAGNDDIDFEARSIMVSAVPEPTTWAMMFIGVGIIGAILRRRRQALNFSLSNSV